VGPVVLGIVAVVAIGLTVWLSTSRPTGIEGHRPTATTTPVAPPSTHLAPPETTAVVAPPTTVAATTTATEIDAGTIATPRPPPTTSRTARTPRTPAEAAGLEGNPYGTP
jgi:hypothetical protein